MLKKQVLPATVYALIVSSSSGCATNTAAIDCVDLCTVSGLMTSSSRDTAETERQVVEHNAVIEKLCRTRSPAQ
jgi:hypothetical protein